MPRLVKWSQSNWFYLALPFLLVAALGFRNTHPWQAMPQFGEAVTLFDWCLFVPLLYAVCYRDMPRRALALRVVAMMCGGIWIAGKIVPETAHSILAEWGWLREFGIVIVLLFEVAAIIAIFRMVFNPTPDGPAKLERQGIPPLLAKVMLAEIRFWRWVWKQVRGK